MSNPTFTYFAIRGLGELPRLCLAAGGVAFTDERIPFSKNEDGSYNKGNWDEVKSKYPYNQLPVLTLASGEQIAQSSAIVRYVAKLGGLDGANAVESALIDAGYEHVNDIRNAFRSHAGNEDKLKHFFGLGLAQQLSLLDKNATGSAGHFVGDKLSIADVAIYYLIFVLSAEHAAVAATVANHPKVAAICAAVESDAKVAAYLAARVATPF